VAVFSLMDDCGLRLGEACRLEVTHLDRARGVLRVVNGKGPRTERCQWHQRCRLTPWTGHRVCGSLGAICFDAPTPAFRRTLPCGGGGVFVSHGGVWRAGARF